MNEDGVVSIPNAPPSYEEALKSLPQDPHAQVSGHHQTSAAANSQAGVRMNPSGPSATVQNVLVEQTVQGILTHDATLNSDPKALLNFFVQNCTAPSMEIVITGYHMERHRSHGQKHSTSHKVVDFHIRSDLTQYINPVGMLYAMPDKDGSPRTVPQILGEYLSCKNKLKSLQLKKHIIWDYTTLETAIRGVVRSSGYMHNISIEFRTKNDTIEVHSPHGLAKFARSTLTQVLCCISCLWIIGYPIYALWRKRFNGIVRADFQMKISTRDWYYANYQNIWRNLPSGFQLLGISARSLITI